jgi:hypothetical protein
MGEGWLGWTEIIMNHSEGKKREQPFPPKTLQRSFGHDPSLCYGRSPLFSLSSRWWQFSPDASLKTQTHTWSWCALQTNGMTLCHKGHRFSTYKSKASERGWLKYKRLKLDGGQAYDRSSDQTAAVANITRNGRAIAQAVSRWLPTAAVRGSSPGLVMWDFVVDKVALG